MTIDPLTVSVVVPFFNEEACVEEFHRRLDAVMQKTERPFELVYVNDRSRDGTLAKLQAVQAAHAGVRLIDLACHAGQTGALAAGFAHAVGDIVIPMDGDLQHVPEEIPRFLEKIDAGYDIVSGRRMGRREHRLLRRIPSWIANRLMAWVSGVDLHDFGTTFKAYRRAILDRICLYGEFHRFIPALAKPLQARVCEIPISAPPRETGHSNYGITRAYTVLYDLIRINFMIRFLARPLQFFGLIGFVLTTVGCLSGAVLVKNKYVDGMAIMADRGPLFLTTIFVLLAGLQMFSVGFLGEMITRLYHETGSNRVYTVKAVTGRGLAREEGGRR